MKKLFENFRNFTESNKPLVITYFGGFKPPHKGHLAVVEEYLSMPEVEKVYILFGDSPRMSDDGSVVVDGRTSKAVWELLLDTISDSSRVEIVSGFSGNPMVKAAELAWDDKLTGRRISAGYGSKEPEYGERFLKVIKSVENRVGPPVAEPVMVPTKTFVQGVSATKIRNAVASDDMETIAATIPAQVSAQEYIDTINNF